MIMGNGVERRLSKYEVIKKIMESQKINEEEKVRCIKTFLLGWLEAEDIEWLWREED